jgi:thiamine-monophosphate kinase
MPSKAAKIVRSGRVGSGAESGELSILSQIRARATVRGAAAGLSVGIGDDCALLRPGPGEEVAVTTDLSIAGRHFRLDWHPPESIGHRALARGLSDLAAMGARPLGAFLSLGLPRQFLGAGFKSGRPSWISRFYDGLLSLAERADAPLAGGDLAESPVVLADIVLVGAVPRGRALLRSGARPGDLLYVTGALGGAAAGLSTIAALAGSRPAKAEANKSGQLKIPKRLLPQLAPHLYPQPRVAQGLWLQRRRLATAAIDLSDGLSTDLTHICQESRISAELDTARLPLHGGATLEQALHGGEDYELLFTAGPSTRIPRSIVGVPVTCIGRILRSNKSCPTITLLTSQGSLPLTPEGWEHFR